MGLVEIFTWIPLILFGTFLFFGPICSIPLKMSYPSLVGFNLFLSLAFFFQHSLMIRKSFHAKLFRWVPMNLHRALFAVISGMMIFAVVIFWQPSNDQLFTLTGIFRWVAKGVFLVAIIGFLWAGRTLKDLDTSGAKSIRQYLENDKPFESSFTVSGPYRWVRHPLYFFTFLMIWSFPDITTDRLLFNFLWSGWIVVGAHLEEKDLIERFGNQYRTYQQQVPMLIPKRIKPYSASVDIGKHPQGKGMPVPKE